MRILLAFMLSIVLAGSAAAQDAARISALKRQGWDKTDFTRLTIPLSEVMSGGPPKDGIPSIDKPKFAAIKDITGMVDREPVITVAINGDVRAYPLRILTWHEIVNDTVGGKPVTVTYCPLCNAAIVFDRTVKGKVLDFGTTGLLRKSDLVMYDRQTQSWWQQFAGEAIAGSMTGTSLTMLPARLESYKLFKQRHPGGKVLVPNNPGFRRYGLNPYRGYDTASRPFLYAGPMPEGISPMARVVVVRRAGKVKAWALALLSAKKTITDGDVVLSWQAGQASALDTQRISEGRDIGNITVQVNKDGKLSDIAYDITFAFVVKAFNPKAKIIKK